MNLLETKVCGICGALHDCTNCTLLNITNQISDNVVSSKARLTLPGNLRLIQMADETFLTVANDFIKKGTQFGPFQAQKLFSLKPSITLPLKVFNVDDDFSEYFLDTTDEYACNWMIFVNSAQTYSEQNLICFQDNESIYYVTIKDINIGEYLKVWYSPYYAKKMNKELLKEVNESNQEFYELEVAQKKNDESRKWNCKFCGHEETNISKFAMHILEHYTKQLQKRCELCKQSFRTLKNWRTHMKIIHAKQLPTTKACKNIYESDSVGGPLINNILDDSCDYALLPSNSNFEISDLENQNPIIENLNLQIDLDYFNFDIDENQDEYICDICLKGFAKLPNLVRHFDKHTGKFTCSHCLRVFSRNENLKGHNCTFTNSKFECESCEKKFTHKKYLIRHVDAVHFKKFTCEKCNKRYYSQKEYKEHECGTTKEKSKFSCIICSKIFLHELYLKRHMKIHMPSDKPKKDDLICEICALSFASDKNLRIHMLKHNDPTFSCKFCNKKFYRQDVLENHVLRHNGVQYPCIVCDKKLKSKFALENHLSLHTGEKRHKCSKCFAEFRQRTNMMKHYERKHAETCINCNEDFSNRAELKQHLKVCLHQNFECPLCHKIIKMRGSLIRHLKNVHPLDNVDLRNIKCVGSHHEDGNFSRPMDSDLEDLQIDFELLTAGNNQEVCLSIPDLTQCDQEITLGKNAYVLENGNIIEPQEQGKVVVYLLDQKFSGEIDIK